uniref:WD_REPEATS_REGION domain-containing protein n=1 Tax=Acrobeloides nanus TaxID=290746 RepID=A0A914EFW3_9BILA
MLADEERQTLINRVKEMKEHEIHFINELNDREEERQRQRLQSALEDAVKMIPPVLDQKAPFSETDLALEDSFEVLGQEVAASPMDHWEDVIPERCKMKFECNELGEVTDVLWHPNGKYFFTAGNDKKIKMFELLNENYVKKCTFTGANQTVTRIDMDPETKHILGSSNDYAVRIWSIDDQRHRAAFTGHTDKVNSAKFFASGKKIASGSQDRTIKIWDIGSNRCAKTFFPGSTVLDIGTNDRYGMPLISAHFDKNVRFWDTRCDAPVNSVLLNGKVTSLFLSPDYQTVLCLSRDETLSLIDLRNYNILHIYSAEQFRTSSDSSRCVISPGGKYCAAGSADGQIFIWNIATTKLEKILYKNAHEGSAVLSLAWHPAGNMILSGDRKKTCCIWK